MKTSNYIICGVLIHNVPLEARKKRFIYYEKDSKEFAYASNVYVPRQAECIANINWRRHRWGLDKA